MYCFKLISVYIYYSSFHITFGFVHDLEDRCKFLKVVIHSFEVLEMLPVLNGKC